MARRLMFGKSKKRKSNVFRSGGKILLQRWEVNRLRARASDKKIVEIGVKILGKKQLKSIGISPSATKLDVDDRSLLLESLQGPYDE